MASSVCNITSDEDYERLQQKSHKKLKKLLRDEYSGKSLTDLSDTEFIQALKTFRKKCDEENYGVTHFGIPNALMKLSTIRFDILHLKLSVTRKILTFTRSFLEKKN